MADELLTAAEVRAMTFMQTGFPCQCWYFRERGRPYSLHIQPDSARIVELLERIEYNTRSR